MKKVMFFIIVLCLMILNVSADENTFYLGEKVPEIRIIMDKGEKGKVFRQFREIYQSRTNELVYCIEPGTKVSDGVYTKYTSFNNIFNINHDKFNKITLIAKYGYKYNNHTDIKWYAITQYLIWKEVLPEGWDLYFVDENKNKLPKLFTSEINEILSLVNNHLSRPDISGSYSFNYGEEIIINDSFKLISNYDISNGYIVDDKIFINENYLPGDYNISLNYKNYNSPGYFFNNDGQNILKKGDLLPESFNFNIHVTGGKLKINECDEESLDSLIIGGNYEILDQDDEVIQTISCTNAECLSDFLPVGNYKIRVKDLPDNYEENNTIYDFVVEDENVSQSNICSLKKKKVETLIKEEPDEDINVEPQEEYKEIEIPYTDKNNYTFLSCILILIFVYSSFYLRKKKI